MKTYFNRALISTVAFLFVLTPSVSNAMPVKASFPTSTNFPVGNSDVIPVSDTSLIPSPDYSLLSVVDFSTSGTHTCAVLSDGTLRCWGQNAYGQLGDGTYLNKSTPTPVVGISEAISVSAGPTGTCAVLTSNTIKCWGQNDYGQLGDGTTLNRPVPTQVLGISRAKSVEIGRYHTCAEIYVQSFETNDLFCWGRNDYGQLGDDSLVQRLQPVPVDNLRGNSSDQIIVGDFHTCTKTQVAVYCWGKNDFGQLGDGTYTNSRNAVRVLNSDSATSISGSGNSNCVSMYAELHCWGENRNSQFGQSSTTGISSPLQIQGVSSVSSVSVGESHVCVLSSQDIFCLGNNNSGQLGIGTTSAAFTPSQTVRTPVNIDALDLGTNNSCALVVGGGLLCWGENSDGQTVPGAGTFVNSPQFVPNLGTGLVELGGSCAVVANGTVKCFTSDGQIHHKEINGVVRLYHYFSESYCALKADGTVFCWGKNISGLLGNGTTTDSNEPVQVQGLTSAVELTKSSTQSRTVCAMSIESMVSCWGNNAYGQVGDGTTTNATVPKRVIEFQGAIEIVSDQVRSCAVINTGRVLCAGQNLFGVLGDGTTTDRSTPVEVVGISNASGISIGDDTTCLNLLSGHVRCWGENLVGQLGDGSVTSRIVPSIDVIGISTSIKVVMSSSGDFACSLKSDGTVWCWGGNWSGQLGDGTKTNRWTPVKTNDINQAVDISVKGSSCAKIKDGTVKCWGVSSTVLTAQRISDLNRVNQVSGNCAIDTFGARLCWTEFAATYTKIFPNMVTIKGAWRTTCSLTNTATMRCWGNNSDGQLGDGTTTNRYTPVNVRNLEGVESFDVDSRGVCAITLNQELFCWGDNSNGQIGDGSKIDRWTPVQVPGIENAKQVIVRFGSTCVLHIDGTIKCWGSNTYGSLGDGTTISTTTPVAVQGISTAQKLFDGGGSSTCAILKDGIIRCWGYNGGDLGVDPTIQSVLAPSEITGINNAIDLNMNGSHACALLSTQEIKCWGRNWYGQLGDGTTNDSPTSPVKVNGINNAIQLSSGSSSSCALLDSYIVKCWGSNSYGQLGNTSASNPQLTPISVSGLTKVSSIHLSQLSACAVLQNQTVACWGRNSSGQLGMGDYVDRDTPQVIPALKYVHSLSTIENTICALTRDIARCWGAVTDGVRGVGTSCYGYTVCPVVDVTPSVGLVQVPKIWVKGVESTVITVAWHPYSNGNQEVSMITVQYREIGSEWYEGENVSYFDPALLETPYGSFQRTPGKDYEIRARFWNSSGSATSDSVFVSLRRGPSGPSFTQSSVIDVSQNSVSLTWLPPNVDSAYGDLPPSDYVVEYQIEGDSDWSIFEDGVSSNQSVTVSGLNSGTSYVFRIYAMNSYGKSYKNYIRATTLSNLPSSPILSASAISSTTANLSWIQEDLTVNDYIIQYRVENSLTWLTYADEVSREKSIVVTGLSPGVSYEFRVGAVNDAGTTFSDIATVTTWRVPDAPIVTLGSVSSSSVGLSWSTPFDGGSVLSDYVVEYRVQGALVWLVFDDGVSTGTSATVNGLSPGVSYEFRVGAVNSIGTSYSESVSATTDPVAPDAPVVSVGTVSSSSVRLSWTSPFDGGSALTDYAVEYRVQGALVWLPFEDGVSVGTSAMVTGLLSSTTYEFRVGAVNSVGTTYSTLVSATTLLPNFTITSFTPSSVSKGAAVDVVGSSLSLVTEVRIGTLVVPFRFVSDQLLVVTVPTNASSGVLRLISSSQNVSAGTLTVASRGTAAPTITVVEPYVVSPGAVLRVQGSNIGAASVVRIAGLDAVFSVTGRNALSLTLPLNANNGKVTVITPGGTATSSGTVTMPPRLQTTSTEGGRGGTVVLLGENLADVTSVSLNGVSITPSAKALTSVSFVVPSNAVSGSGFVTGPGGVSSTFTFTLLPPPVLNAFSLSVKVGDTVTLSGSNLQGVTNVLIGTVAATSLSSTSTTVTFVVPTGAKTGTVTFTGAAGTVVSSSTLTVLAPPVITGMTPTSGKTGTTVTITGTGLTGATVTVGTKTATKSTNTATQIKFKIPSGLAKGTYTVKVVTANGETTRTFKVT